MRKAYRVAWIFLCLCFSFHLIGAQQKIHLIFQVGDGCWERDWIREVFSKVEYEEIWDGNWEIIKDRSVIVTSQANLEKCQAYFNKLHHQNCKFGILHLSDEQYIHDLGMYKDAIFILRNYWHKDFLNDTKIHCFALGYKNKFWEDVDNKEYKSAIDRKYIWSFAGQVNKSSRMAMVKALKQVRRSFLFTTSHFADPAGLNVVDYRNLLLDTIFVPCPRGNWNLDTFRLYEALECGCIPIIEKTPLDYFSKFYGPHPFLVVSSWREAPRLIKELLSNPDQLEGLREKCFAWWVSYKARLQTEMVDLTQTLFD